MMNIVNRLFARSEPALSEAGPRDAAALAVLHAASFQRGWSEHEIERMLSERNVVAHRATSGRTLAGFIFSRLAAGEAEILSVAVSKSQRGRGLARSLLNLHLRRLAGLGTRAVFLEVGDAFAGEDAVVDQEMAGETLGRLVKDRVGRIRHDLRRA